MGRHKDIKDDEIRIIGAHQEKKRIRPVVYLFIAGIVVAFIAIYAVISSTIKEKDNESGPESVFEPSNENIHPEIAGIEWLGNHSDTVKAYTEHLRDTINDIPLDIYIPHNAVPELVLGVPDIHDKSIILTTQAADIRADNGKIVGAFVMNGKPLSWGLSKKGYCGIIDGKITVGTADNSPLFEEATEKGGHFFRQYPLVDNGKPVENPQKGKSIRKALCDRNGEIMVIMSKTPESFHDFTQALVDMRVDNAIYLVGSSSFGYFRDYYDQMVILYNKFRYGYRYENFIVWKEKK